MKTETNNQGKSSASFFKQSTGIPVPVPVSHKKVPLRLLFLKTLYIPAGTTSYSGPWTTLTHLKTKWLQPCHFYVDSAEMNFFLNKGGAGGGSTDPLAQLTPFSPIGDEESW